MILSPSKPFWIGLASGVIATLLIGTALWALQGAEQASSPLSGSPQGHRFVISYQNGLLSADLQNADLRQVLEEIAQQTGIKVSVSPEVKEKVSVAFTNLEPREALERLLGSSNYTLVFKRKGINEAELPSEIQVLSRKSEDGSLPIGNVLLMKPYKVEGKKNGLEDFTFSYPEGWMVSTIPTDTEIFLSSEPAGPPEMGISVLQNEKNLPFEDWLDSKIASDERLQNATESQSFSVGDLPAYAFYLPASTPEGGLPGGPNQLDIFLSRGKFVYRIQGLVSEGRLPLPLDNLSLQILSSMRFN